MKTTRSTSQLRRQFAFRPIRPNVSRGGWTVLEVLISSGIMVVGLACVASLLPAAAQRMAQAVSEDRAGTVAANAYADIMARRSLGLLSARPGGNNWAKSDMQVFGTASDEFIKHVAGLIHPENGTAITASDWENQDALEFDTASGSPVNTFGSNGRKTRANPMCWLATLVPDTGADNPVVAGNVAELSIAVFKKQPSATEIVAGSLSGGVLTIGGNRVDDDTRRQFAKGCGAVLALASTPEWLSVNASWTDLFDKSDPTDDVTTVILEPLHDGAQHGAHHPDDVVLFTNLLRVEKHRVVLD